LFVALNGETMPLKLNGESFVVIAFVTPVIFVTGLITVMLNPWVQIE
jgi:hypothetical protein